MFGAKIGRWEITGENDSAKNKAKREVSQEIKSWQDIEFLSI
jgi:hypothetical protein